MVALAVIAHDFADGLNTVTLMLAHGNPRGARWARWPWTPPPRLRGAASTLLFQLPPVALALYLGFFAGFLLYIGASDILPEAHSERSSALTILLTCVGVGFVYVVQPDRGLTAGSGWRAPAREERAHRRHQDEHQPERAHHGRARGQVQLHRQVDAEGGDDRCPSSIRWPAAVPMRSE